MKIIEKSNFQGYKKYSFDQQRKQATYILKETAVFGGAMLVEGFFRGCQFR